MTEPGFVLHQQTRIELDRLLTARPHAIILEAPAGSGKDTVVSWLAAEIAAVDNAHKAVQQVLFVDRGEDKTLKVEKVRGIEQFLMRKLPGNSWRVVVLVDAHTMVGEAQNALLKTLEEPPERTVIILLSSAATALLPTVRSRVVTITLTRPTAPQLKAYFLEQGYAEAVIDRALLMSGGLPGLLHALLSDDENHPLLAATATARQLIQSTRFSRLAMVDNLSKQREQAVAVCQMLERMARVRLQADATAVKWQQIMLAAYAAEDALINSGQPKLVLTNLMLEF